MDPATLNKIMNSSFECDICEQEFPPKERVIWGAHIAPPSGVMWVCPACNANNKNSEPKVRHTSNPPF